MTLQNWQVFAKDPRATTIPNDGVTEVGLPKTDKEWEVLRYELSTFVCDGEYQRGLERILSTYLTNLERATQPAVWVSGFYGSGKSHLVRVLEYLWRDVTFPDGATARGLVNLSHDIEVLLRELATAGKREGGLWAAAGTLGAGAGESVRLAILGIVFKSAGLPENYVQGRFVLWLKQQRIFEDVHTRVEASGESFDTELNNLYVSPVLANAVLGAMPDLAASNAEARALFKEQFRHAADIENEEMLEVITDVLALQSGDRKRLPCTLLVLDELQQYITGDSDRTLKLQVAAQALSKRFGSKLLLVGTGQSALQAHPDLQKLKDRFTVQVELTDTDVEKVLRQVVLRKAPTREGDVRSVLDETSGEIDRQLQGTKIAATPADQAVLVADYPLLPSRRRFWERLLRAIDRAGAAGQLRTQLRTVHESTKLVAEEPLATVVPGDTIYNQQSASMLQSGVLLPEIDETIRGLDDGTPDGRLRSRLCALVFLVSQLPTGGHGDIGVRPTVATLADLLVRDLRDDGTRLRQCLPGLLEGLVEQGTLLKISGDAGDEYRLQTRESSEWEQAYRGALMAAANDAGRIASERAKELRQAVTETLKNLPLVQGESKTPRRVELSFSSERPEAEGAVPVWIRDEWSVSEKAVRDDAQAAGMDDPVVYVFLPKRRAEDVKNALAGYLAASEVLHTRGAHVPTTAEGIEAKKGMETRLEKHRREIDNLLAEITANARVYQGGGTEVIERDLRAAVHAAAARSIERLYREFTLADSAHWKRAMDRAREGSSDPLAAVGHTGDTAMHPACVKVLNYVGGGGKTGSDVRRTFDRPPYGWPREAVDASLLSLLSANQVSAELNGSPVTSKQLDGSKIGGARFRRQSVVLEAKHRLAIREVFTEVSVNAKSGEELQAVPDFLERMRARARAAGGEAPAPRPPDTSHLDTIAHLSGNEQLMEIFSQRERLLNEAKDWKEAKDKLAERHPRWAKLQRLLHFAARLPVAEEVKGQANAVLENRQLLAEPDPIPPLCNQLASALREELASAYRHLTGTFEQKTQELRESETWKALPQSEARLILERNNLHKPSEPPLGTEEEVLAALEASSLADLADRADAIEGRVASALKEAAKTIEPTAVAVELPRATLRTKEDAKNYLARVEQEIMRHLEEGNPVMV